MSRSDGAGPHQLMQACSLSATMQAGVNVKWKHCRTGSHTEQEAHMGEGGAY
jgi:hypothetical protein